MRKKVKVLRTNVYVDWLGTRYITRHTERRKVCAVVPPSGIRGPFKEYRRNRDEVAKEMWKKRKTIRLQMGFKG